MSLFGESLWPEDARQPYLLELGRWPTVGSSKDAIIKKEMVILIFATHALHRG